MSTSLLAITDALCPASTRYRVTQFEGYLKSKNTQLRTMAWSKNPEARAELLAAAEQADVVVFQRYLPDAASLRAIRRRAARLVYDFDDAVMYSESARGKSHRKFVRGWRFRRMMRCCDAVSAGNEYLAVLARRHAPASRVHVLPTAVEPRHYESPADSRSGNLVEPENGHSGSLDSGPLIGWIGSSSTLPYLERLRRPLEHLAREMPSLSVRVIADRRPDLGNIPVQWVRWDSHTEVGELKRLHVGVAPLPDDPWTRGKCGLRLLQYLAAGVPAVASPVGTQGQVTESGAALAAYSDADWIAALRRVLADRQLARFLAGRGRQLLRERFAAPVLADSIYSIWCGGAA